MTQSVNYLDPRILAKITRLELRARLVVEGFITGGHQSPYHGFAVEFANHRQYVPGDEIRHIDWKVWARQDRLYVKEYEEETNLRCTLVVDASRSMGYGRGDQRSGGTRSGGNVQGQGKRQEPLLHEGWSKWDHAATAAASLAYLLHQQQDAVGLVTFDHKVRCQLQASTHGSQLKQLLHQLQETVPDEGTDVGEVFTSLVEALGRRGLVVLVSDLLVDLATLKRTLMLLRKKRHEVVLFHVLHEDELTFPFDDPTLFEGLEDSLEIKADPPALRRKYLEGLQRYLAQVKGVCGELGIDYVMLDTGKPLDAALSAYLSFRSRLAKSRR